MTLGRTLAAARDEAGMTVEDVSRATRIRGQLVRQIEADDFAGCGGTVYARGHVRAIATAIGLDPVPLLAEFDRQFGNDVGPAPREVFEHEVLAIPERKGPNWTAAMAVAAAVALFAAVVALLNPNGDPGQTVADPRAGIQDRSPSPRATAPSQPADPSPAPTDLTAANPYDGQGVLVLVRLIGEKSWLRITDERGQQLFQGVLTKGATREFRAPGLLHVVVGNAGAVQLVVNGRDLGSPGANGQVVRTQFGPGDPTAAG